MSNATVGSLLIVVVMFIAIFSGLNLVANEVEGDPNLDLKSQQIIFELNNEVVTNYNISELEETDQQTQLVANSTFEGVDAFARQFLEDKSEITQKKSTIDKLIGFPEFIVKVLGFDSNPFILLIISLIVLMMGFWIGFAIFKGIKGEVD